MISSNISGSNLLTLYYIWSHLIQFNLVWFHHISPNLVLFYMILSNLCCSNFIYTDCIWSYHSHLISADILWLLPNPSGLVRSALIWPYNHHSHLIPYYHISFDVIWSPLIIWIITGSDLSNLIFCGLIWLNCISYDIIWFHLILNVNELIPISSSQIRCDFI